MNGRHTYETTLCRDCSLTFWAPNSGKFLPFHPWNLLTFSCKQKLTSILLTRGRLSFPQLVRFSELKPRAARTCTLTLVQHNLLWHTKGDDDYEMFEVNVDECLMRLRFGRFTWLSEELFGKTVQLFYLAATLHLVDERYLGRKYNTSCARPWKTSSA